MNWQDLIGKRCVVDIKETPEKKHTRYDPTWYEGIFDGIDEKNGIIFLKDVRITGNEKLTFVAIPLVEIELIESTA